LIKSNLIEKISAVCVDKRTKDAKTGQLIIVLENGKTMMLPPNIHSVPSLLIKSNFHVIAGDEIMRYYQPQVQSQEKMAVGHLGEPSGFDLGNYSISDQYTFYSDTVPHNIQSQKNNMVDANHTIQPIHAEPDNYRPNKMSSEITVDKIHTLRNEDIKKLNNDDMNAMIQEMTENRHQDKMQIISDYKMSPQL
jgi:hypothetical protein